MRIIHRYLGFFLAGIMMVYSISGITLIFRDTDYLKKDVKKITELPIDTDLKKLGGILKIKNLKIIGTEGDLVSFKEGTYNKQTGIAEYTLKELPFLLDRMVHLHKAKSERTLSFLNVFFGLSLLFFLISAFWMYMPSTTVFKKGLYFSLAGLIFALLLIFL